MDIRRGHNSGCHERTPRAAHAKPGHAGRAGAREHGGAAAWGQADTHHVRRVGQAVLSNEVRDHALRDGPDPHGVGYNRPKMAL